MKTMTAVLSNIVKLNSNEYETLTTEKRGKPRFLGGVTDTTRKLKAGEAFHVSNVKNVPSQAYEVAKQLGFKVVVRSGLSHIGQPGFWVVRKHG